MLETIRKPAHVPRWGDSPSLRLLPLYAAVLLAPLMPAQTDLGSITGFVKDPSGAIVPKAQVMVRNEGTSQQKLTTANDSGYYAVPALPPGYYSVAAEATGFKRYESTHIKLDANTTLRVDAALEVGATSETVEVSDRAVGVQADSAAVQQLVSGTQVQVQELNGRDPLRMAQLLPGVEGGGTIADFNFAIGNPSLYVNGARQQDTLVTYDSAPRPPDPRQHPSGRRTERRFRAGNPGHDFQLRC